VLEALIAGTLEAHDLFVSKSIPSTGIRGNIADIFQGVTGVLTRFTDYRDPKPRSRPVFFFHQPQTLLEWYKQGDTLRDRLTKMPELDAEGLRPAQERAIRNLEMSFKDNRPKALIQMATGAGKTFTACSFVYRLLAHAKAKRILFLVDTKTWASRLEMNFLSTSPTESTGSLPNSTTFRG